MATAVVYDPIYLEHDAEYHPENADRLRSVVRGLDVTGLKDELMWLEPAAATVDDIATVHKRPMIDYVRRVAEQGGGNLDPDTYVSPRSYEVALRAAGGCTLAMEAVIEGKCDNAFALVRPPGHHALAGQAMGFCLFNNIAIATRLAQARHGLKRVMIVDFDVHHGNGTQATFYRESDVLYFSVHEYPHFPGTGTVDEIGEGEGRGYNINVPLGAGVGDEGYGRVFTEIVMPAARRYRPEIIAVSAGYDTHWMDPLAAMKLTVAGCCGFVKQLREAAEDLCDGKLVFALEGGYDLRALTASVVGNLQVLMGRSFEDTLGKDPNGQSEPSIDALLRRIKTVHGLE